MSSKTVLMVSSTASMIKQFNHRNIILLQKMGYRVIVAANFTEPGTISVESSDMFREKLKKQSVITIDVPFGRGVGSFRENVKAAKVVNKLFLKYDIRFVHVHSALAGVITRIIAKIHSVPVLYTVHGFQFTRGGSTKRWILYFPVEWILSFLTKGIIVLNDEDEKIIQDTFCNKNFYRINGVGVDITKFHPVDFKQKVRLKEKLGLPINKKIFLTVGELSNRKNQELIIKQLAKIDSKLWHYVLIGKGPDRISLENLAKKLGVYENISFLGYRENVLEYYQAADYGIYMSKLEGLLTAGMESLATGLPLIGANVRGIQDLIEDGSNGFVVNMKDKKALSNIVLNVMSQPLDYYNQMVIDARNSSLAYDREVVDKSMIAIYREFGNY